MPSKTESIKSFLTFKTKADLASMYNQNMECQVNVSKDNGEQIEGEWQGVRWIGYSDGNQTWKPFRIPWNASTNPEYIDTPMSYDLGLHAEAIGMTGWDWANKMSRWVAYDFDAILGHSDKHTKKLTSEELKRVQDVACGIPWVTVRYSTSGKGLHLYVFLDDVSTANHTEHAALARSILSKLSSLTGYDFQSKVDACVPSDTWTLTAEGPRQVKDIIDKESILIVNGKGYKTDGFRLTGYKEVFEIETVEGFRISATSNHPFLVDYDGLQLWQKLEDLQAGNNLCLQNHQNFSWGGEGSFDEGYILGWLVGDGCLSQNDSGYMQNKLYFHESDFHLVNYAVAMLHNDVNIYHDEKTNRYTLSGKKIEHLRIEYGLDETKTISSQIEESSSEFHRGFISAFFDTDGSVSKRELVLGQSNLSRLESVQRMLLRFGIKSTVRKECEAGKKVILGKTCNAKTKYNLKIYGESILTFVNRIGFKHFEKNKKVLNCIKSSTPNYERFLVEIKSIKSIGQENVYDVTVPGVHAFDANGLTLHNCGGNIWSWHRKMKGTNGLELIKQGEKLIDVPSNWRDHVTVVKGTSKKISIPTDISQLQDTEEKFDVLSGQRTHVSLDKEHVKLITYLNENGLNHWWDADRHMLVTHTASLKRAHIELGLKGLFDTETKGTSSHNVFLYPMRKGAWSVRRFTPGVKEHASWDQDGAGWTRCYFNQEPTFQSAAHAYAGIEDPSGGYHFFTGEQASNAANALGANLSIHPRYNQRQTVLKQHKDGNRLIVEFSKESTDQANELVGWLPKGSKWIKIISAQRMANIETDSESYDDLVRHLITDADADAGWVVNCDGKWNDEPLTHVRSAFVAMSVKRPEMENIIGNSVLRPWTLVKKPFQPEYPGDRVWNRHAPQLRYPPSISDTLCYPTWIKILQHIGQSLDPHLQEDSWFKKHGIKTGADYLKIWIASMFQYPNEPLPYLFLYSDKQNTGKSTLPEALELLFHPGYMDVKHALQNPSTFNGEIEGAILCAIDEMDLTKNKFAYDRIKEWVTSPKISIHPKHVTPYMVDNTLHFIHTTNNRKYIPMFPGDTRITMIHVQEAPSEEVPKRILLRQLEKEASDFLGAILNLEIPESPGRLRVPVITTSDKLAAEEVSQNEVQRFIEERCFQSPGYSITMGEFYDRFIAWLDPAIRPNFCSKQKVSNEMPDWVVKGRINADWHWGNISWTFQEQKAKKLICIDKKLVPERILLKSDT